MSARRIAVPLAAASLAALALAATAAAEPIDLGPARLDLDARFTGPDPGPAPITSVTRQAGATVVVATRLDVPNTEAWRERTRAAHVDAIVAGFAAAPGYKLLARKLGRLGGAGVPTLDLSFRRRGPVDTEVVAVRVLLFRTMTIAAIAASPNDRAAAERAVAALAPE